LDVPQTIKDIHKREQMQFGPEYIIPSPFDRRVLVYVASAVAQAATKEGGARIKQFDFEKYRCRLKKLASHLDGVAIVDCNS